MATLAPTTEQIASERQYLNAAKLIAEDYQVELRMGDGALDILLPGAERPRLIITVHVQGNGRAAMEIMRIDDNSSEAPTVLTLVGADGTNNQFWTAGFRQIIINHGGEPR